ncbi:MAG: hypothetical protein CMI70_01945 [Candidatus Pelagibacter sp.]|jgi:hypothetical protein|nr:hypothetical protein [Candidatus Pelagibacter sp.]
MTTPIIEKLYFSPVKSLSFSYSPKLIVKKKLVSRMIEFLLLLDLLIGQKQIIMKKIPKTGI